MCAKCKLQLGEHLINHKVQNAANLISDSSDSLQYLITQDFFDEATSKDLIKIQEMISEARKTNDNLINAQSKQPVDEIFLNEPLLNVANKRLGRQCLNFKQLTPAEPELWNKLEKSEIYDFLTGEKDTVPEYCSNCLTFSDTPKVTIDTDKIAAKLMPIPQNCQLQAALRSFSASATTSPSRMLRDRKTKITYKALHLGQTIKQYIQLVAQEVKQQCKQMWISEKIC
jgi:hypothetical protein